MLRRLLVRLRHFWALARSERASPREIGWAVAVGVFAGCTPAFGLHGWLAVGFASVLRLNRLFAFLGSRISFFLVMPWITLAEIEVGHRLRTGEFADIALDRDHIFRAAGDLLLDLLIGTVPVGAALAAPIGFLAFAISRFRANRQTKELPLQNES